MTGYYHKATATKAMRRRPARCTCGRKLRRASMRSSYCPLWRADHALEKRGFFRLWNATCPLVRALEQSGVPLALDPTDAGHTRRSGLWVPGWCFPRTNGPGWLTAARVEKPIIPVALMARVFRDAFEDRSIRYRVFDVILGAEVIYGQIRSDE